MKPTIDWQSPVTAPMNQWLLVCFPRRFEDEPPYICVAERTKRGWIGMRNEGYEEPAGWVECPETPWANVKEWNWT